MSIRIPTTRLTNMARQQIRSSYMLTEVREMPCGSGGVRLQLVLEDAFGSVLGFVWPEHRHLVAAVAALQPVEVVAEVRLHEGKPQLHVRQMTALDADRVVCASELLPNRRCPEGARGAHLALQQMERSLPEPLAGFLRRALLDPAIGVPMMRCRASVSHHHSQPGGLLIHSTSGLALASELAQWALPDDPMAPALSQTGLLFHDTGKIRSVGESSRPYLPLVIRHETHTLLLLAPHLLWLESQDRGLAEALKYILEYVATPPKSRGWANYLVAEIVVQLDCWSAASHNGRDLASLLVGNGMARIGKHADARAAANDRNIMAKAAG